MPKFSWEALSNKQEDKPKKANFKLKEKVEKKEESSPVESASAELRRLIEPAKAAKRELLNRIQAREAQDSETMHKQRFVEIEKAYGEAVGLLEKLLTEGEWIDADELRDVASQIRGEAENFRFLVREMRVHDKDAAEGEGLPPKIIQIKRVPVEYLAKLEKITALVNMIQRFTGDELERYDLEEVAARRTAPTVKTFIDGRYNSETVSAKDREKIDLTIDDVNLRIMKGGEILG
ncbi:hypothetical protein HZB94_01510 [Candidatus Falkowbacteria bacterium]|nr:hypothetical protein [Candidatus Falkowbacteria bacterium]